MLASVNVEEATLLQPFIPVYPRQSSKISCATPGKAK